MWEGVNCLLLLFRILGIMKFTALYVLLLQWCEYLMLSLLGHLEAGCLFVCCEPGAWMTHPASGVMKRHKAT
jgi:hypothetical protein